MQTILDRLNDIKDLTPSTIENDRVIPLSLRRSVLGRSTDAGVVDRLFSCYVYSCCGCVTSGGKVKVTFPTGSHFAVGTTTSSAFFNVHASSTTGVSSQGVAGRTFTVDLITYPAAPLNSESHDVHVLMGKPEVQLCVQKLLGSWRMFKHESVGDSAATTYNGAEVS